MSEEPKERGPGPASTDVTATIASAGIVRVPVDLRDARTRREGLRRSQPPPKDVGTSVGRYVLRESIGAGGMGAVYAAYDPELDRTVAVKLLHAGVDEARLVREAKAMAKLAHPNVVAVYDVGTYAGGVFLTMELVDGVTLKTWLKEAPRSWRDVVRVFVDAGRGLAAAHAQGIVHRDFKPENVLIGRDGRVRVLDFGIAGDSRAPAPERPELASEFAGGGQDGRLTGWGVVMGTPAYMAPEQFLGVETDERTDQYSYAVALWEALFGERPHRADSLEALAAVVWRGTLPDVTAHDVPGWLTRIVTRGLSVFPAQRYRSMNALLADIDAGLASDASAARVVGKRYDPIAPAGAGEATLRALDRLTGQIVTLVWVGHAAAPADPVSNSRHARDFERLASLRHPNLAPVLDFGLDHQQRAYFVLGLREQPAPLLGAARDEPRAIQTSWLVQLLRALVYLHRRGLAHGDLSPANVGVVSGRVVVSPLGAAPADPATVARDLHAVGVMSYQLFGGRLTAESTAHPRTFDVSTLDVERPLAAVVEKLVAGESGPRFETATDVLAALGTVLGRPLTIDDAETRESFLQAGRLVGREAEVAKLGAELERAVEGQGGAWLVGGESGAGKSRLLDELRTLARARGALVFRGQEEREGGSPYRLWQGALRWLAIATDVGEHEASVLLPVVPDLPRLLGREVAPAPHVDAPSAHARLVEVVVGMLSRPSQPMVLLLEDAHWARSDSMKLLQAVAARALGLPLLVVCTFRDDERPELPGELPSMRPLRLGRLPSSEIASVGESMIGPEGRRPDVVAFLERETEGNPFFLVEVVRALAEEAGSLDRIGKSALPEKVFAGGVRRVVQRRLRDLPDEARPSLRAAAIIGRKVDVPLLRALSPSADVDALLDVGVAAAVLERREGVLRFSHDKLREGMLLDVDETERRALHARVARAIEQVQGDAPAQRAALAHHWGAAGDRDKEAHYAALAGEEALEGGARQEGTALLKRALALRGVSGGDPLESARLHRLLSRAAFEAGEFASATEHGVESLALLGVRIPTTRRRWWLMALGRIAVLLWLLVTPRRRPSDDPRSRRLAEVARAASRLAIVRVYQLETVPVLALSLAATAAASSVGRTETYALGVLGFAAGAAGLRRLARRCFDRGRAGAAEQHDVTSLIDLEVMNAALLVSQGEFDRARERMTECAARAESLGYRLGGASAESLLARCDAFTGSHDGMVAHFERSAELLQAYAPEHRVGQVASLAMSLAALGRVDEARARVAECAGPLESRLMQVSVTTARGIVHARTGDLLKARADIDAATALVGREHAYPAPLVELLEIPGEVYVTAWRRARETRQAEAVLESATRGHLAALKAWTRLNPIGAPAAAILAGDIHDLRGNGAAAIREWRRALALAEARGMRVHAARAEASLRRASQSSAT